MRMEHDAQQSSSGVCSVAGRALFFGFFLVLNGLIVIVKSLSSGALGLARK